jgi:hypothetical protein
MQPSSRKFGNAVRKVLKDYGFEAPCTATTTSFSGFGYGESIQAEITTSVAIPDDLYEKLLVVRNEFELLADKGNHFIVSLGGSAYPFGGTIKEKAPQK